MSNNDNNSTDNNNNHNNNNNDESEEIITFNLSEDTRQAGFIQKMHRRLNTVYVTMNYDPENNPSKTCMAFTDITSGKLDQTTKSLKMKIKEVLLPLDVDRDNISLIISYAVQELTNNLHKLDDLSSAALEQKKEFKAGSAIWDKDKDKEVDINKLKPSEIRNLRKNKNYAVFANKVTKTKIIDPVYAKLNSPQSLTEDERFQLYEDYDKMQFVQHNMILYEAFVFKAPNCTSSSSTVADETRKDSDDLTEQKSDTSSPKGGENNNSIPTEIFLEDGDRYTTKFVYFDRESDTFKEADYVIKNTKVVFPEPTNGTPSIPYEFYNIEHLNMFYRNKVKGRVDISNLFAEHLAVFKYFNVQPKAITIAWAAAAVVSYFQDLYAIMSYFAALGIPGSGKSTMLETMALLSYRAMKMNNPNAAQAIRMFGNVEPAQHTFIADEADKIDKDSEFMPMIKNGYMYSSVHQKVNTNTMALEWFYVYAMKFFGAEKQPKEWHSMGFHDRTFEVNTKKIQQKSTDPNIKELGKNTGLTKLDQNIKSQILDLRKKSLIYRMVHYNDPRPDLDVNIGGRDKELTYPFLQLFHGSRYQSQIEWAFQSLLDEMNNKKRNSLSVVLCLKIATYLYSDAKSDRLKLAEFWNHLKQDTSFGTYMQDSSGKKQWIESPDYGDITMSILTHELRNNFKTDGSKHTRTGNVWTIDIDAIIARLQTYLYDRTKIQTQILKCEPGEPCEGISRKGVDDYLKNYLQDEASSNDNNTTIEQKLAKLWSTIQELEKDNAISRKKWSDNGQKQSEQVPNEKVGD